MAHPKRKQSKTRTAKRRTHDVAVARHWLSALTVVHGTSTTKYVVNVATTVAKWLSKKLLSNKRTTELMPPPNATTP